MRAASFTSEAEAEQAVRVLWRFDCEPELEAIDCGGEEPPFYEVRCHELPTKLTDAPRLALVAQPEPPEPHEDDFQTSRWWDRD